MVDSYMTLEFLRNPLSEFNGISQYTLKYVRSLDIIATHCAIFRRARRTKSSGYHVRVCVCVYLADAATGDLQPIRRS